MTKRFKTKLYKNRVCFVAKSEKASSFNNWIMTSCQKHGGSLEGAKRTKDHQMPNQTGIMMKCTNWLYPNATKHTSAITSRHSIECISLTNLGMRHLLNKDMDIDIHKLKPSRIEGIDHSNLDVLSQAGNGVETLKSGSKPEADNNSHDDMMTMICGSRIQPRAHRR